MREHVHPIAPGAGAAMTHEAGEAGPGVEVFASVEPLLAEWETLADRIGASPFQRSGWMQIWARHFGRAPLQALGVRRRGRLAGLLPFVRHSGGVWSPTNFHSPEFGVLAEDVAAVRALYQALFEQPHAYVALGGVLDGSPDVAECVAAASRRHERVLTRVQQQPPFLELTGRTWIDHEASLPAKLRGDLRRRRRKLEAAGALTVEIADGSEGLDRLLTDGFAIEPSAWKARRGTAISSRSDTAGFYRELATWAAGRGILRLAFLRLDGRALAFQFALEDGGAYYFLKGGYDVAFSHAAPGKLLLMDVLAHAYGCGLQRFEFLGTAEAWKAEWTPTCRTRLAISAFGRGAAGQVAWLGARYARPAAKRLRVWIDGWRRGGNGAGA